MPCVPEIIEKLKLARKEKGLSYQDVADLTEEAKCAVSLTSVKRVFSSNSEAKSFRYDTTIKPLVQVLLSDEEENLGAKDGMIDVLNRQIALMENSYCERINEMKKLIEKSDKLIRVMGMFIFTILCGIIAVLVTDNLNPDIGWFLR